MLHHREHEWAIKAVGIDPPVDEPTAAASLPAGRQAASQRNGALTLIKTDGLAEQQPSHHASQKDKVTCVADRTVLREEASQLSMETGAGIHEGMVSRENPKLSWITASPIA